MQRSLCAAAVLVSMLGLVGCGGLNMEQANVGAKPNTGFMVKQVVVNGDTRNYGLFIPHNYTPQKQWPVIVFLHGIMEAGNNGTSNMGVGLGPAIAKRPSSFDFIAVFPQSPGEWGTPERAAIAIAALDQVEKTYSTDKNCVTLTGLSNGGHGTWYVGATHASRFSALVPICGYRETAVASKLTAMPIRCYHATGDMLVSCQHSRDMVDEINKLGGKAVLYDNIGTGHGCWEIVYDMPDVFDWMKAQRRGGMAGVNGMGQ